MMILNLSSLNKRAKLLSSYLPSRVLRAPGTSSYHLVPKHLRATWPRPEQSHLIPEACSPDGTDKRRQRQRRTERPPPEPSNIFERFCALYDVEIRYYKKRCLNYTACLTVIRPVFPFGNIRFQLKLRNYAGGLRLINIPILLCFEISEVIVRGNFR